MQGLFSEQVRSAVFSGVFLTKNLRRHYKSQGHPINYGIILQNAFPMYWRDVVSLKAELGKRYPYLCSGPERKNSMIRRIIGAQHFLWRWKETD